MLQINIENICVLVMITSKHVLYLWTHVNTPVDGITELVGKVNV